MAGTGRGGVQSTPGTVRGPRSTSNRRFRRSRDDRSSSQRTTRSVSAIRPGQGAVDRAATTLLSVANVGEDSTASGVGPRSWVPPGSPDEVEAALRTQGYLPGDGLSTAIFLAIELRRPLFLEGEPGVGKTEVANVLARSFGTDLLRLQCYEGIDAHQAIYEWDYQRQLLYLRVHDRGSDSPPMSEDELFSERF